MADYRRWYLKGGTYFFTVVTQGRQPLFAEAAARNLLGESVRAVAAAHPFETLAIVLLPDHLHALWRLPRLDADFSTRWKKIKSHFSVRSRDLGERECRLSESQKKRGDRGVWQRRFWEHLIRDEADLEAHFDYIHFNPVKHGLVSHPRDWEWSTFHKYVRLGHYPSDWGRAEPEHVRRISVE